MNFKDFRTVCASQRNCWGNWFLFDEFHTGWDQSHGIRHAREGRSHHASCDLRYHVTSIFRLDFKFGLTLLCRNLGGNWAETERDRSYLCSKRTVRYFLTLWYNTAKFHTKTAVVDGLSESIWKHFPWIGNNCAPIMFIMYYIFLAAVKAISCSHLRSLDLLDCVYHN